MIRLGIRVRADRAELALAELLELVPAGVEERELGELVEYAVYAPEGELPPVGQLTGLVDVRAEPVEPGWERRWHEHLEPVRVRDLVVRPPWIEGAPGDLVIDPGELFGAGTHPTTRLCLELLLGETPGGALCDWGAGTGVLAIAAARLGWAPVTAVEIEPGAPEVIRANAERNGVEIEVRAHDLRQGAPWAPTVVANLPKPVLLEVAGRLGRLAHDLRPATRIVASGMLAAEADEVVAAFGLYERRRVEDDGWAGLVLG